MTIDAVQTALSGQGLKSARLGQGSENRKIWIGRDATNFFADALDEITLSKGRITNRYGTITLSGCRNKIEIHNTYSDRDSTLYLLESAKCQVYRRRAKVIPANGLAVFTGCVKYWSYMEDGQ